MSVMSVQLLSSSAGQVNVTGTKKKADGFFGFTDGKATIGWYLNAFIGRIVLEASLATDPEEADFFPVAFDGEANPFVEFLSTAPATGLTVFTVTGNFVWVRAVVDRTNISPLPPIDQINTLGTVSKVLMNF